MIEQRAVVVNFPLAAQRRGRGGVVKLIDTRTGKQAAYNFYRRVLLACRIIEQGSVNADSKRSAFGPLAQLIATHLARNYAEIPDDTPTESPSLPGFKLKQVTEWIKGHLDAEFDLDHLAAQASLSKFHFHRLFKQGTGVSPAKYQLNARMDEARRRLRETKQSVIAVALDLGYSSPSHFAQVFRRETRMTPSEYRRQR